MVGYAAEHGEADGLILAMAGGDEAAFAELWVRYAGAVRGLGHKFLGSRSDGEDVAQEAFHKAWRMAARFDPDRGSGRVWLFAIARNVALDRLRRQRIRWLAGLDELTVEPEEPGPSAERATEARAKLREVHAALLDLPDAQRMALLLSAVAELETPEIAMVLGRSRGAVEQLVVRARRTLRERMEETGHA